MKIYRIHGLLLKHWYTTINSVDRILDILFWPIVNLIIWGFASKYVQEAGAGEVVLGVFLGGLILYTIFDRAQKDTSMYIVEDFWNKSVYSTYVTPVTEGELFVSVALLGICRAVIEFMIVALLALAAYGFNIFVVGSLGLFVIPLFIFGWAVGLLVNGIIFQYGSRISIFIWSIPFLIEPFAAVFYPVSVLPPSLQAIAAVMPLAYIFEGLRAALDGAFLMNNFVIALLLSIAYFIGSYALFRFFIKRGRRTGFLSKQ